MLGKRLGEINVHLHWCVYVCEVGRWGGGEVERWRGGEVGRCMLKKKSVASHTDMLARWRYLVHHWILFIRSGFLHH